MPRKKKIWYPGAMYHIMCRGNHRQNIFRDDADRQFYLMTLLQVKQLYPLFLYSYCLMDNHVHLQVETTDFEISKIMQRINKVYAVYFNEKYNFVGHLFQGRFQWELIDKDSYNLEPSRYIHLNPVRAEIIKDPLDYHWSSYSAYILGTQENLVDTIKILEYFSEPKKEKYKRFVEGNEVPGTDKLLLSP
ncbi:transposase [Desulfotomaculum nigrificans]|uniref:transposase n=1 Tax=Desulfotomaculum nigrificans TaxID=1565 RepID=UPI0001FAE735|nr:transposase [Desulfotomaculum nigrificans]